jgi:hypothetical protein
MLEIRHQSTLGQKEKENNNNNNKKTGVKNLV